MADQAELRLSLRLVPVNGFPNAVVFDDIVRLIRQGVATAPSEARRVEGGAFRTPVESEHREQGLHNLESQVKHRIEQASANSESAVEQRKQLAQQPDGQQKLAEQSLLAAEQLVAAVQRAMLRGIAVRVPDDEPKTQPPTG